MKDPITEPGDIDSAQARERRDARRALDHWLRHASGEERIPLLAAFDFASIKGDWSYRFLICTDEKIENAAFVAYGDKFAELLGLPEKVAGITRLNEQIPERYWPLFLEGCTGAMTKRAPARFSGEFENDITAELFRAVFLPIRLHPSWSKWLIFGSFNSCTVLAVDQRAV